MGQHLHYNRSSTYPKNLLDDTCHTTLHHPDVDRSKLLSRNVFNQASSSPLKKVSDNSFLLSVCSRCSLRGIHVGHSFNFHQLIIPSKANLDLQIQATIGVQAFLSSKQLVLPKESAFLTTMHCLCEPYHTTFLCP